jgi:hypothetical protein
MRDTYRVAVSTLNRRSIPWPFGLVEIRESSLFLYSRHWSWWAKDRQISKDQIRTVRTRHGFGVLKVRIEVEAAPSASIVVVMFKKSFVAALKECGYEVA